MNQLYDAIVVGFGPVTIGAVFCAEHGGAIIEGRERA
jgi:hypothetical protein